MRLNRQLTSLRLFINYWGLNCFALHQVNWSLTKLKFVNYKMKSHYYVYVSHDFVDVCVTSLRT